MSTTDQPSKDIQGASVIKVSKPGKRKLADNHSSSHGNADDSVNKKEIQDGFSWWTSMMVGADPKASQLVVNKVCQNKIDLSSKGANKGDDCKDSQGSI